MKNKNKYLVTKKTRQDKLNTRVIKAQTHKVMVVGLITVLLGLSMFYLFQVIGATVLGFEKQNLENELNKLKQEQGGLKTQVSQLSEIQRVKMNSLGMINALHVEYLDSGVGSMAMAR